MKNSILLFALIYGASAQAPTGSIAGVVRDASGAVVTGAQVKAVNLATGLVRSEITPEHGGYTFPALLAGEYEVSVEAPGFRRMVRQATVEAGVTTTADFAVSIGDVKESVTVDSAMPQMHYDSNAVSGVVTHGQIENLPLNGRSFIELAKLEPGVQAPSSTINNRTLVPVLGAPVANQGGPRITVDGGSVTAVGFGGSQMGLSQEAVQEFQVSTVNPDLSTGISDAGAINVVTRSGGNDLHGTALYFFRDHKLAAYPALNRDPADPDPFFQRRQFGFALGGPVRRDRIFFFGNWERNEQRGVVATTVLTPEFAPFNRITSSPLFGDLLSLRLDARVSSAHTVFVRQSHDGSWAFAPDSIVGGLNAYPSGWIRTRAWADQSLLGVTSVLRPTLVNDLRFSYFFVSSGLVGPTAQDCAACIGLGFPAVNVAQTGLYVGRSTFNTSVVRRLQLNDSVTWQPGKHRVRFGVDWEYNRGGYLILNPEPAALTLFSPAQVRASNLNIPLPAVFRTMDDLLKLPLQSVTVGVGDPRVPQPDGSLVRKWNTVWPYFQDTWRLTRGLTLNYGLGWSVANVLNYDLHKPILLAPLLGADGLGPTRKQWKNLSPVMGLAWSPWPDGKTVIRAGGGFYYANQFMESSPSDERAALSGPGLGRQNISGTAILNPLPGIPGVPVGKPLDFRGAPTLFTGAEMIAIVSSVQSSLLQSLGAKSDPGVQAIQLSKQAISIFPTDYHQPSALHANLGVQREIVRDFVVGADIVYRHFLHAPEGGGFIDLNHFNSSRGPVIPRCVGAQANDPQAICSLGKISVYEAPYRFTYKGLLVRAEKRFSRGFQVLGSYAWSSNTGTNPGTGFNLDNWLQNTGPTGNPIHVLNVAGVVRLPRGFELGLNGSYSSATPLSAFVGGIDFNGDGTAGDLLPGSTFKAFNRSMGRADLERLVGQFNSTYAGTKDAQGRAIPRLALPSNYSFGDNFQAIDLRLSRAFVFRERWRLSVIGEVFNVYNAANLSGYSGDLTNAFGQPTSRSNQVFGSGGPRAFQLALRVSF